jgi:hypothetical protein
MRHHHMSASILLATVLAAGSAAAQTAISPLYVLEVSEPAPSARSAAGSYRLDQSLGCGVVAARAASGTHVLLGGYPALLEGTLAGRPCVTAVRPLFAPLLGGTALTIHGADLHLGGSPTAQVGGVAAAVGTRRDDQLTATLPRQTSPGWKPVAVTNAGGTGTLADAVGILPMLDRPRAVLSGAPFRLTYRGAPGDVAVWMLAGGSSPFPIPVPPFLHGLELDLATMVPLTASVVTDPSGELHLDLPAVVLVRPLLVQAITALTTNPGYAPGAFTNALQL